jgi:integrase
VANVGNAGYSMGTGALLERAKLSGLKIHDLRRTFGSWQAMTGSSLPIIGKSLGHSTPASTAIYSRLTTQPVVDSVGKATAAMLSAAKKGNRGAAIRKILGQKARRLRVGSSNNGSAPLAPE